MGLNPYKEITDLVGAAGDSIVKLTDGIKHAVSSGVAGYNYVVAKRDRRRLKEISAQATNLRYFHQGIVARSIDEYLEMTNPPPHYWHALKSDIIKVIELIKKLLEDVMRERSDFVLADAYSKLVKSLGMRAHILGRISEIPPPSTDEERKSLQKLNKEYKRLLTNFGEAINQLNLYLKDEADV